MMSKGLEKDDIQEIKSAVSEMEGPLRNAAQALDALRVIAALLPDGAPGCHVLRFIADSGHQDADRSLEQWEILNQCVNRILDFDHLVAGFDAACKELYMAPAVPSPSMVEVGSAVGGITREKAVEIYYAMMGARTAAEDGS